MTNLRALRAIADIGRAFQGDASADSLPHIKSVVVRGGKLLDLRDVSLAEEAAVEVRVGLVEPVVSSLQRPQAAPC